MVFLFAAIALNTGGCKPQIDLQADPQVDSIRQQLNAMLDEESKSKLIPYRDVNLEASGGSIPSKHACKCSFSLGGTPDEPELSFDLRGEGYFIKGTERAVSGEVVIDKLETDLAQEKVVIK